MRKSLQWSLTIALIASVLALASAPARHAEAAETIASPVAFDLCTGDQPPAVQKCQALGPPPAYQVPAGRVLIVEQVSGDCGSDAQPGLPLRPQIVAQTSGTIVRHTIIGVTHPDEPGGRIPLTLTRIYADANSSVTIGLTDVPGGPSGAFCRVSFSGRLEK
jgi:hypothetical protein